MSQFGHHEHGTEHCGSPIHAIVPTEGQVAFTGGKQCFVDCCHPLVEIRKKEFFIRFDQAVYPMTSCLELGITAFFPLFIKLIAAKPILHWQSFNFTGELPDPKSASGEYSKPCDTSKQILFLIRGEGRH